MQSDAVPDSRGPPIQGGDGPGDWGDGGSLNRGPNQVPAEKWCVHSA